MGPDLPELSQSSISASTVRWKAGADGCGRAQEWKKHRIVTGKAPSHQCFGAPGVLKPQKASMGIMMERFLQAFLPTTALKHTETSTWIYKPAMKEDVTQAIFGTSSFISSSEKNMGFFIKISLIWGILSCSYYKSLVLPWNWEQYSITWCTREH